MPLRLERLRPSQKTMSRALSSEFYLHISFVLRGYDCFSIGVKKDGKKGPRRAAQDMEI